MSDSQSLTLVQPSSMPHPAGHYSPGVVHNGVVYVSGQLGRGADMSDDVAGDIAMQTQRALASVAQVLQAAGSDMSKLLKVNLYVSDVALWGAVNATYREVLGAHRPARAIVPTGKLHYNALIEIDAVAAV